MNELTITEHNVETGEVIIRPLTDEEIQKMESEKIESERLRQEAETKKAVKAVLLQRLGITEEEAKLLLS